MTDIALLEETPDTEYDPTPSEYAESDRLYQEVLTPLQQRRYAAYCENDALIQQGIEASKLGERDQIRGAHKIWKNKLWKEARSELTGAPFKSQEQWIQECIDSHRIKIFSRTNFFEIVEGVEKAVGLGLDYEQALQIGLNHSALEAMEQSGAVKFQISKERGKTIYVPTVTPLGEEKLLKSGLKSAKQYVGDLAEMTPREALKTVQHDVGKRYAYCSNIIRYTGETDWFEQGDVYAVECRFVDPNNGETPYNFKVVVEKDAPKEVVEGMLCKWKGDFRA